MVWKKVKDRKTEFEFKNKEGEGVYGFAKLGGWVVRRYNDSPFGAKDLVTPLKPKNKTEALRIAKKYMSRN